jgi:hypothetical protein
VRFPFLCFLKRYFLSRCGHEAISIHRECIADFGRYLRNERLRGEQREHDEGTWCLHNIFDGGNHLDLPGSEYTSYQTFGPGQTPEAVVVGYGYWDGTYNHPQQYNLQLIEVATGRMIFETSGYEYAGKAAVVDLPIRKDGYYQLKLLVNNKVYDTWDFAVDRGTPGSAFSTSVPNYAKGIFSVSLWSATRDEQFATYDANFLRQVTDAVQKASNTADRDIFSQVLAGKVDISFQLDDTGNLSSPQIQENTLNDALGQFFLQAFQDAAPYKPWTGEKHTRALKVTIYYQ